MDLLDLPRIFPPRADGVRHKCPVGIAEAMHLRYGGEGHFMHGFIKLQSRLPGGHGEFIYPIQAWALTGIEPFLLTKTEPESARSGVL
jgi:hypothetical protein